MAIELKSFEEFVEHSPDWEANKSNYMATVEVFAWIISPHL